MYQFDVRKRWTLINTRTVAHRKKALERVEAHIGPLRATTSSSRTRDAVVRAMWVGGAVMFSYAVLVLVSMGRWFFFMDSINSSCP